MIRISQLYEIERKCERAKKTSSIGYMCNMLNIIFLFINSYFYIKRKFKREKEKD